MAYTTVAKVKSMFRGIKIADATGDEQLDTAVTTEDVEEFIEDADAEINAKLSEWYVTPVTGTESLKLLGVISKYKVAHIIKTILEVSNETSDLKQDVQTNLGAKADKMLNDLCPVYKSGKWLDPVTTLIDADKTLLSPETSSVFQQNLSGVREPTIKKGGGNW